MFEVRYSFIQTTGTLKGLTLRGDYKVPARSQAVRDARRIAAQKDVIGAQAIDLETGLTA